MRYRIGRATAAASQACARTNVTITTGDILGAAALVVIGLALGAVRIVEWNEKRKK